MILIATGFIPVKIDSHNLHHNIVTKCIAICSHSEQMSASPMRVFCLLVGLHRSVERKDILKFKCLHAAQCDVLLKKVSAEARLIINIRLYNL